MPAALARSASATAARVESCHGQQHRLTARRFLEALAIAIFSSAVSVLASPIEPQQCAVDAGVDLERDIGAHPGQVDLLPRIHLVVTPCRPDQRCPPIALHPL